jgi:hypothetical protein
MNPPVSVDLAGWVDDSQRDLDGLLRDMIQPWRAWTGMNQRCGIWMMAITSCEYDLR